MAKHISTPTLVIHYFGGTHRVTGRRKDGGYNTVNGSGRTRRFPPGTETVTLSWGEWCDYSHRCQRMDRGEL